MSAQPNSVIDLPVAQPSPAAPLLLAVVCDFAEEGWPSMDLVGDMLIDQLHSSTDFSARRIRPHMKFHGEKPGKSARFFGRFITYPRLLRKIASNFDLFHIVDHSYAHLVHQLPPGRTIVTCHDLDTFRCLLEPNLESRSFAFRGMTRRILTGLQAAAHVTCDTAATRDAILAHQLLPPERLTVVHNGVHPSLSPLDDPRADVELIRQLGREPGACPELLHVGSTIARKRIDVLLRAFAEVRERHPNVRLVRVGTPFTEAQETLARSLRVRDSIDVLPYLETNLLAACYRRASLVLQPSEAEGFGLPVVEAMACGTPVIASDIPSLREIGGDAVLFCAVGHIPEWVESITHLLNFDRDRLETLRLRALQQASLFSWSKYANRMSDLYLQVLAG